MIKIKTSISAKSEYTGIYLAYPTTTTLKQTYRNHKSMVNDQHTKVGITVKSFRERSNEYERTFDGEVEFVPLVVMEPEQLALIEKDILSALRAEFGNVGRTREWFDTSDRTRIIEIVQEITGAQLGRLCNKNRQFAPTGPDAKTAARFWRRCGKRYIFQEVANGVAHNSFFFNAGLRLQE